MLIVSTSRSILTAAIGREAGTFIDALQARLMLPDDGIGQPNEPALYRPAACVSARYADGSRGR